MAAKLELGQLHTAIRWRLGIRQSVHNTTIADLESTGRFFRRVNPRYSPDLGYTPEAVDIMARQWACQSLETEVLYLAPESFATTEEELELLMLLAGGESRLNSSPAVIDIHMEQFERRLSQNFSKEEAREIWRKASQEELEEYLRSVQYLATSDLSLVESLPYRRILMDKEIALLWEELGSVWSADGGYRLGLKPRLGQPIRTCDIRDFEEHVPEDRLREELRQRSGPRIWELYSRRAHYSWDIDLKEVNFSSNSWDGFWFPKDMEWIIFEPTEEFISWGGAFLIDVIDKLWPDQEEYLIGERGRV